MNGYEAYQIFNAVRLHFTSDYDFFKYGGRIKATFESFQLRKDKYSFVKLSRLYNEFELQYFLALGFYDNPKNWVRPFFSKPLQTHFEEWKIKQKNRPELLESELKKINFETDLEKPKDSYPALYFKLGIPNGVDIDAFLIIDHFKKITDKWNKEMNGDFLWDTFYNPLMKYKAFFYNYTLFDTTTYQKILGVSE